MPDVRLGSKHPYLLSHLAAPQTFFINESILDFYWLIKITCFTITNQDHIVRKLSETSLESYLAPSPNFT